MSEEQGDSEAMARKIAAGVLAHAIRLGKCPRPGMILAGNLSLDQLDTDTGQVTRGEKTPVEFVVTAELLEEARALINAQRAVFRAKPKASLVSLDGRDIPEELWGALKDDA